FNRLNSFFSPANIFVLKPRYFSSKTLNSKALNRSEKHSPRGRTVYLGLLIFIAALLSLPFVHVDIIVKSLSFKKNIPYRNIIAAPISARVKAIFMEEK